MDKIVCYGGGTNSTALIIGMREQNIVPDYIVFADTGGEKPWTYEYLDIFDRWLESVGFPKTTRISGACTPQTIKDGSLENELIRLGNLPSFAHGFKTCSQKWKIRPFEKWAKRAGVSEPAIKYIGFDADEPERMDRAPEETRWQKEFPLIKWWWGRKECIQAIKRAGLPLPGKSSCFFCPASKPDEVMSLPKELLMRAIMLEDIAALKCKKTKGLGRSWAWRELLNGNKKVNRAVPVTCACHDG